MPAHIFCVNLFLDVAADLVAALLRLSPEQQRERRRQQQAELLLKQQQLRLNERLAPSIEVWCKRILVVCFVALVWRPNLSPQGLGLSAFSESQKFSKKAGKQNQAVPQTDKTLSWSRAELPPEKGCVASLQVLVVVQAYFWFFTAPAQPLDRKPVVAWTPQDALTWLGTLDTETQAAMTPVPPYSRRRTSVCIRSAFLQALGTWFLLSIEKERKQNENVVRIGVNSKIILVWRSQEAGRWTR